MVPLWRAAWTRCLSVVISEAAAKHCFSLCSTQQFSEIQNQSDFPATHQATSESTAKETISARISFPARAAVVPLLDWLPACVAHDFSTLRTPTRSVTTLHSSL